MYVIQLIFISESIRLGLVMIKKSSWRRWREYSFDSCNKMLSLSAILPGFKGDCREEREAQSKDKRE
jgi:hypothetical protein